MTDTTTQPPSPAVARIMQLVVGYGNTTHAQGSAIYCNLAQEQKDALGEEAGEQFWALQDEITRVMAVVDAAETWVDSPPSAPLDQHDLALVYAVRAYREHIAAGAEGKDQG